MKKLQIFAVVALMYSLISVMPARASQLSRTFDKIALWTGPVPGQGELLYTLELDSEFVGSPIHRIYDGPAIGRPGRLFNARHYFEGLNRLRPLFSFSKMGGRIYEGPRIVGRPVYFFEYTGRFVRVYRGANVLGPILYVFTEDRVYLGANDQGPIILSTDRNLLAQPAPVIQTITLLLEAASPSVGVPLAN